MVKISLVDQEENKCTGVKHGCPELMVYQIQSIKYRKVASSNTSCLEAHDRCFFKSVMKGIFNPYVL